MCQAFHDLSSGYPSGFLSCTVILNCLYSHKYFIFFHIFIHLDCLCLHHAFPICLTDSCSSFCYLFKFLFLWEATLCPIYSPKLGNVCLHWSLLPPCAYLHLTRLYLFVPLREGTNNLLIFISAVLRTAHGIEFIYKKHLWSRIESVMA